MAAPSDLTPTPSRRRTVTSRAEIAEWFLGHGGEVHITSARGPEPAIPKAAAERLERAAGSRVGKRVTRSDGSAKLVFAPRRWTAVPPARQERLFPRTTPRESSGTRPTRTRGSRRTATTRGSPDDDPGPAEPAQRGLDPTFLTELERRAERIRRDPSWQRCSCARSADPAPDGRCSRCYGVVSTSSEAPS